MRARSAPTLLKSARSYDEWADAARAIDESDGSARWRQEEKSAEFDSASVRKRLDTLRKMLAANDDRGLLFVLNEGVHGNMDGIASAGLWGHAKFGTKGLVEEYVEAVVDALVHISAVSDDRISQSEKADFFCRVSRCHGSSAFLMSGSGSLLFFHFGVAKALFQEGLLPTVISGSSGGSIAAGLLGCYNDRDLPDQLEAIQPVRAANGRRMLPLPGMPDIVGQNELINWVAKFIPDLTFLEAFEQSGRYINISVASADRHHNGRLLNAITSPKVLVRQAIHASCAVPGVYRPVKLMARDDSGKAIPYLPERAWIDGSISHDLPTRRLSRLYGVNHMIVSQANPLVAPFTTRRSEADTLKRAVERATLATAKTWFNLQMRLLEQPLSLFPSLLASSRTALSVVNQEYSGDINIVLPSMGLPPHKLLSNLSRSELAALVRTGERATWPKMEMVRLQTMISRTLAPIVARYERVQKGRC